MSDGRKIFLILFLLTAACTARSQTDTSNQENLEDLLPSVPSEYLTYDYLDKSFDNYSVTIRNRFISNPYNLSPKMYNRFRGNYNNYSIGVITEKDAGEKNLADFYSYYFAYNGDGIVKTLIAGNYTLSFGYGLIASNSYRSGKTSDVYFPLNNHSTVFKSYLSTDENKFFRGISSSIKYKNFTFSAFYSMNRFDAGIDSNGYIISIPLSGTHISTGELLTKDAASISSNGLIAEYESSLINGGILFMNSSFENRISPALIYKKENKYLSAYYELPLNKNFIISGESASDFTFNNNIITANISLSKEVGLITSYRNYKSDFSSYYGNAFGETYNSGCNESGVYSGLRIKLSPFIFDVYFDQYRILEMNNSFSGEELLLNGKYLTGSRSFIKLKYRVKIKESFPASLSNKNNLSLEYSTVPDENLTENIKAEYVLSKTSAKNDGFMIHNEIGYKLKKQLGVDFRITIFKTSSSIESALYEYEKDIPGMFSSKILSGEGMRYYLLIKYKPLDFFMLSLKYSSVYKKDETLNYLNLQTDINF